MTRPGRRKVCDEEVAAPAHPHCDRCCGSEEGARHRLIATTSVYVPGPLARARLRVVARRISPPRTAATADATRIPSLASAWSAIRPGNASVDTNSDTVNPMPPSAATPTSCDQLV